MVLNHSPPPSPDGVPPIMVTTGLPAVNPLDPIAVPGVVEPSTLEGVRAIRNAKFACLRDALESMHKRLATLKQTSRKKGRAKAANNMAQLAIGDYVLYADVWPHRRSTLRAKWCGHVRVVATVFNRVFSVGNLLTGGVRDAHASSTRIHHSESPKICWRMSLTTVKVTAVGGHVIEELRQVRHDSDRNGCDILVKWHGFSETGNSWEPVQHLLEDVPAAVKRFLIQHADDALVQELAAAGGLALRLNNSTALGTALVKDGTSGNGHDRSSSSACTVRAEIIAAFEI
ncbi:hypothetical protein ON010_g8706 [Phytophthora cinnamomi]|nr:hypothetical protein ON010_g8706 [Phytophthora cinnamomi]